MISSFWLCLPYNDVYCRYMCKIHRTSVLYSGYITFLYHLTPVLTEFFNSLFLAFSVWTVQPCCFNIHTKSLPSKVLKFINIDTFQWAPSFYPNCHFMINIREKSRDFTRKYHFQSTCRFLLRLSSKWLNSK